jgi:hypothetical protein
MAAALFLGAVGLLWIGVLFLAAGLFFFLADMSSLVRPALAASGVVCLLALVCGFEGWRRLS